MTFSFIWYQSSTSECTEHLTNVINASILNIPRYVSVLRAARLLRAEGLPRAGRFLKAAGITMDVITPWDVNCSEHCYNCEQFEHSKQLSNLSIPCHSSAPSSPEPKNL